jgi:chromosome segregation ATPase
MLPIQVVEQELKAYARANPGLSAKRLDGRIVLFREGSVPAEPASRAGGVADMPLIDRLKSLFAMRGEYEKKIAFLSERRAALGQKRDRAYEEIEALEKRDADHREQFAKASSELARRRITSQLLQLRKDLERRQQLMSVLNQQINVVSTHLHNLELVQQGQTAKLPDSEEMAHDAAAAEEMLATLQESSEMAETVGGVASSGLSAEEQALYEQLQQEIAVAPAAAPERPATATPRPLGEVSSARTPARPEPRRTEPEAG